MISIRNLNLLSCRADLARYAEGKLLFNTINAYSFNNARKDFLFERALMQGDVLIPDGISIVKACRFLRYTKSKPKQRVAGWDLFAYEMSKWNTMALDNAFVPHASTPNRKRPVVMFMGSTETVLERIKENASQLYPALDIVTYSPPFCKEFSDEQNDDIIDAINQANPDLLWIGMTAPKQEKWAYQNWDRLNIHCHCGTIGAVFDFFACTRKRAPQVWQTWGFEWFYRLLQEPSRMWRRYVVGNAEFLMLVAREKAGL